MDALTVKMNAYREAWGYKVQAAGLSARAQFAQTAGQYQAGASILTGTLGLGTGAMKSYYWLKGGPGVFGEKTPPGTLTREPAGQF
jgi:hypothetical protein